MHPPISHFLIAVSITTIILFSLLGIKLPDVSPILPVGSVQAAAFESGISMFQNTKGYYYLFSPYNDYTLDSAGNRSSLLPYEDVKNNRYQTDYHRSIATTIIDAISGYIDNAHPHITFFTKDAKVEYTTSKKDNRLIIRRTIASQKDITRIGSTINYNPTDIVYDDTHTLITYQPDSVIKEFEDLYSIRLATSTPSGYLTIPTKRLTLINPELAAVFVIKALPHQALFVDPINHLIEVQEAAIKVGGAYIADLTVDVYTDPIETEGGRDL